MPLALIAEQSQGIPREINNICFNALLLGAARRHQTISAEIARRGQRTPNDWRRNRASGSPKQTADSIVPEAQTEGKPSATDPFRRNRLTDGEPVSVPADVHRCLQQDLTPHEPAS